MELSGSVPDSGRSGWRVWVASVAVVASSWTATVGIPFLMGMAADCGAPLHLTGPLLTTAVVAALLAALIGLAARRAVVTVVVAVTAALPPVAVAAAVHRHPVSGGICF